MKRFLLLLAALMLMVSCSNDDNGTNSEALPAAKIISVSDLHYFDPDLIDVTNPDYQLYLAQDRKLITESSAILNAALAEIKSSDASFVIIPGDLTKDGEKSSHEKLAALLKNVEESGKEVFVVPGNHDVNNGAASSFAGGTTTAVAAVTPAEFQDIYADFGYTEALYQDENSLSYIAELDEKLWLFALDACIYESNEVGEHPHTGGSFKAETLSWITAKLKAAKAADIKVIGMMHHGIIPHFTYQPILFEEYVVNDFANVATLFADNGLQVMYTGHYHANDIASFTTLNGNTIYDIETGSLVTWPCPYRLAELTEDQTFTVETKLVENIDFDLGSFSSFQEYAYNYIKSGLETLVPYLLKDFGATDAQAELLTPFAVSAFMAHYAGDEDPTEADLIFYRTLLQSSDENEKMFGAVLQSIWNDPAPTDNTISFELK